MKELKIEIPNGYEIDKEKSTFEKIVFKSLENNYPKTWKECIKKLNNMIEKFYWITENSKFSHTGKSIVEAFTNNYNLLPSKEDAEKFLILQKLWTCRKAYIGDWEPDWSNFTEKYFIRVTSSKLIVDSYSSVCRSFSFPTLEMAEEFLKNFKADLEFVKDLL
jgi:hypothetical protein